MRPNLRSVSDETSRRATQLVDALRLDLVGPGEVFGPTDRTLGMPEEVLPQPPSRGTSRGSSFRSRRIPASVPTRRHRRSGRVQPTPGPTTPPRPNRLPPV